MLIQSYNHLIQNILDKKDRHLHAGHSKQNSCKFKIFERDSNVFYSC